MNFTRIILAHCFRFGEIDLQVGVPLSTWAVARWPGRCSLVQVRQMVSTVGRLALALSQQLECPNREAHPTSGDRRIHSFFTCRRDVAPGVATRPWLRS